MSNFKNDTVEAKLLHFQKTQQPVKAPDGTMWYGITSNSIKVQINGKATAVGGTSGYSSTVFDATNPAYAGGAKHDVIIVKDATFNSTSTVATTANDPPFVCPGGIYPCSSGGDVGKIIFGTNQTGGGITFVSSVVILPQGTITSITDAHHAVCSTTATQSITGTLAWGHDDTAAIQAAKLAADNAGCQPLQLPAGAMFISTGFTNGVHPWPIGSV